MSGTILIAPMVLQGFLMFFDEFFFHHKRGLPKWEILGHPLDTMSVITPLLLTLFFEPSPVMVTFYALLAVFSCFLICKDEWVHKDLCSHGEMALHALLFSLHPLVFLSIYQIWKIKNLTIVNFELSSNTIILGQVILVFSFLVYQITYWIFYYGYNNK